MGRVGIFVASMALLVVLASAAGKSDSNDSSSTPPPPSTPSLPTISTTTLAANSTKEGLGQGRGHRRHDNYGNRHGHRGGHRRGYDDDSYEDGYDVDYSHRSKPYFDTHYCSVHGSFRLAYNEKVEKKEYSNGGYDNNQQSGYGNQGGYGGGNYQQSGGYGQSQYGGNQGGYGERPSSYKHKERYVRKTTRQYCRYAAAWSEKACKFCCKVVARSAYTSPDDIIAAIFSFDPTNPTSGGAGIEKYKHDDKSKEYGQDGGYNNDQQGYGNQGGYDNNQQSGYGNQGGYDNQQGYGNQGGNYNDQQSYSPPQYGSGPYRAKRDNGYSQAPTYGQAPPAQSYDQYSQPAEQYQQPSGDQYSATSGAYETKPDYGNKYENNVNAVNQCVCCSRKSRHY